MEEFPVEPQIICYIKDDSDDTLYNSSIGYLGLQRYHCYSSIFHPFVTSSISSSSDLSDCSTSRRVKISEMLDENTRSWTRFTYQFSFHILDEYRANKLQTILLENNYYHTSLEPIIVCKQEITERNIQQEPSRSAGLLTFYPTTSQDLHPSDSKALNRVENRKIVIKYSVYFCGIVRPLSHFYQLNLLSFPFSSSEKNVITDLFHTQLTDFPSYLTLLLFIARELNELHSQGLCHSHLEMSSFALYTPSTTNGNLKEWGIQILSHWLFLPSGPSDPSCTIHLPDSRTMLLSIQSDSYRLGKIFLEMTITWIARRSIHEYSNSPTKLTITDYYRMFLGCIASNECTAEFRFLLHKNLQAYEPEVYSEFLRLLNGLIHSDPWERYECFQIEVIITEMMALI